MADLFAMKSPLVIRFPDGRKHIMAEYFRHPEGLLYFDVFWHQQSEAEAIHLIQGEYKGEGPWKVGDCVINVLGCHGTDPELASLYSEWQTYRQMAPEAYPGEGEIRDIAVSRGAVFS
ncbi:MAG: hypothetical protein OQL09_06545 [Gammaproteobacteria bacterium]|nr:hypothetical protein [Gammaproteobacteria bacterium]